MTYWLLWNPVVSVITFTESQTLITHSLARSRDYHKRATLDFIPWLPVSTQQLLVSSHPVIRVERSPTVAETLPLWRLYFWLKAFLNPFSASCAPTLPAACPLLKAYCCAAVNVLLSVCSSRCLSCQCPIFSESVSRSPVYGAPSSPSAVWSDRGLHVCRL